jgi:hypothetical protein
VTLLSDAAWLRSVRGLTALLEALEYKLVYDAGALTRYLEARLGLVNAALAIVGEGDQWPLAQERDAITRLINATQHNKGARDEEEAR